MSKKEILFSILFGLLVCAILTPAVITSQTRLNNAAGYPIHVWDRERERVDYISHHERTRESDGYCITAIIHEWGTVYQDTTVIHKYYTDSRHLRIVPGQPHPCKWHRIIHRIKPN